MNSDHRKGPIERCLRAVRTHLGLDVAFVGEFVDGQRVFRYVDAADESCVVTVGDADPVEDSYCLYVANGRLPGFLPDPAAHPVSARLPATDDMPVGTHLSVPIRLGDGRLYGTFCCFSFQVHDRLDERDLAAVEMLAAVVAGYLEEQQADRTRADQARQRIRAILDGQEPTAALQPIVSLATGETVGVEALSRFPIAGREPGPVFTEAWACGLAEPLELEAVRVALACLADLPAPAYLAINASPATSCRSRSRRR